jgi:hypothetical protein
VKERLVYSLVRQFGSREVIATEAPAFAGSLVFAEVFYKFHSFTLECAAFLATWLALSRLANLALRGFRGRVPD